MEPACEREDSDPPEPPLAVPQPPTPGTLIAAFVVVMSAVLALLWLRLSILTAVVVVAAAAVIAICLARGAVRPLWQILARSMPGPSVSGPSVPGPASGTRDPGQG